MDKQKQIDLMAEMYNDIMYFALVVLPHHFYLTPADFHREIAKQLGKEKPDKYTCIVAPRGHAKSSLVSLAYILHQNLIIYKLGSLGNAVKRAGRKIKLLRKENIRC